MTVSVDAVVYYRVSNATVSVAGISDAASKSYAAHCGVGHHQVYRLWLACMMLFMVRPCLRVGWAWLRCVV